MAGLADLIGRVLDGKYHLDKLLGQGGMGAVYLATHLGTKRLVALKVIAPQLMANEEFVERFKREAEAAGRLRHPNVVYVTDFGFARAESEQLAYLVMEYLDGGSLGATLKKRGPLPLPFVIDVVEQICLAIDHAHQQGIIHRDLKPDNIWLEPNGRGGYNVKVLDFGLAKLRDATAPAPADKPRYAGTDAAADLSPERPSDTVRIRTTGKMRSPLAAEVAAEAGTGLESPTVVQLPPPAGEEETKVFTPAPGAPGAEEARAAKTVEDAGGETATMVLPGATSGGLTGEEQTAVLGPPVTAAGPGGATTATAAGITQVGAVLGTPLYMSPEQCRGAALDARSDIYSLGIIVYLMLAGEPPFSGDINELILKHCDEPPPPLAAKRADIPEALAAVVTSALAKEPARRPASAAAFAAALRATSESDVDVLRQARLHYNSAMLAFMALAFFVYLPFIVLTLAGSLALGYVITARSAAVGFGFGLVCLWLLLLANNLKNGACALAVKQQAVSLTAVSWRQVMRELLRRPWGLVGAALRSHLDILTGLLRLVVPGVRAYVANSLAGPVAVMEGESGRAALARSRRLVRRLRLTAAALQMRDFGLSLGAILIMPFFTMIGMLLGGATGDDMLGALASPWYRVISLVYAWFFAIMAHTAYSAVPLALLYFRAREANGEAREEQVAQELEKDGPWRRPRRVSRSTLANLIVPLMALAFVIITPLVTAGDPLITAARAGQHSKVKQLLAGGADVNTRRRVDGTTALMFAARSGYLDIVHALLVAGAAVNQRDNDGDTALMYAALEGRTEVAKALLAAGADANAANKSGDTMLMAAARRGRTDTVEVLLRAGAAVGAKDRQGKTALAYATQEGYADIAQLLKVAGAKE